jgi:hypothetical protein
VPAPTATQPPAPTATKPPVPTATTPPAPTAAPPPPSSGGIALGATIHDNNAWVAPGTGLLEWYANLVGKMPAVVNVGSDFVHSPNFDPNAMSYIRSDGSMPMYTWSPDDYTQGASQPNYTDKAIASGKFDTYIRQFATASKNWGQPYYLRFAHEMNGNWYPWGIGANGNSASDYIAMWRHVHDIFTSVGATNVRWVWCPNVGSNLAAVYPGDSYVDWIGLDGYDRGGTSLQSIFANSYNQAVTMGGKPILIGETGTTEQGGTYKANWITQSLLTTIPQVFPRIKAVLWFDWAFSDGDWRVNTSASSLAAFKAVTASPLYQGVMP